MTSFSQDHRPMRLHVPSLPENRLLLAGVDGEESVSQLSRFTLDVRAPRSDNFDFDELLGKELNLDILDAAGGLIRQIHGIAAEVGETGRDRSFVQIQIEMAPRLWLLTQTLRSRIFQEMSVVEIVEKVLKEHAVAMTFRLHDSYPVRNYTTQYQESDFEFISRLLEDHGIYYYFESDANGGHVVFADQSVGAPAILGSQPIEYREPDGGVVEKFHIHDWRPKVRLRPSKFLTRDHSFQLPRKPLETRDSLAPQVAFGAQQRRLTVAASESLLQYEYPGDYAKLFDSGNQKESLDQRIADQRQRTVRVRAEEQACRGIEILGISNCPALTPGFQFNVAGIGKGDGAYLITSTSMSLRMPEYRSDANEPIYFECCFECLPAGLPYRPRRDTPQPAIHGSQTATVVGGPDGEVVVDKFGRVKVHFHWDLEGTGDGKDSCWIRVASPWAGHGWGMVSHPRVGQEVVVDFQDGDPDRPLVIGSVYNPEQPTPYDVPDRRNEMCIKSRTVGGDAGDFHGLSLNDSKGSELFRLRSQKDMVVEVKNNHHLAIPNVQTNLAGSLSYAQTGGLMGRQFNGDSTEGNGWQGVNVGAGLAYKVDTTFGGYSNLVIGFGTQQFVGAYHEIFVSPLAILGAVPLPGFTALAGVLGKSVVSHGGDNSLVYGPRFHVHHGPKKEHVGKLKKNKLLAALAATHAAATIANVLAPGLVNCWDVGTWKLSVLLTEAAESVTLGLLTAMESLAADVADLELTAAQNKAAVASCAIPPNRSSIVAEESDSDEKLLISDEDDLEGSLIQANLDAFNDSLLWAEKQWSEKEKLDGGQKESVAGDWNHIIKGRYEVRAADAIVMDANRYVSLNASYGFDVNIVNHWEPDDDEDSDSEQLLFTRESSSVAKKYVHRLSVGDTFGFSFNSRLVDTEKDLCAFRAGPKLIEAVVSDKAGGEKAYTMLKPDKFQVKAMSISFKDSEESSKLKINNDEIVISAKKIRLCDVNSVNSIVVDDEGIFFNGKKISEDALVSKTTTGPEQKHTIS